MYVMILFFDSEFGSVYLCYEVLVFRTWVVTYNFPNWLIYVLIIHEYPNAYICHEVLLKFMFTGTVLTTL